MTYIHTVQGKCKAHAVVYFAASDQHPITRYQQRRTSSFLAPANLFVFPHSHSHTNFIQSMYCCKRCCTDCLNGHVNAVLQQLL